MSKYLRLMASTILLTLAATMPARADGLPGMRGHDHTGVTAPDRLELAAPGARLAASGGRRPYSGGDEGRRPLAGRKV